MRGYVMYDSAQVGVWEGLIPSVRLEMAGKHLTARSVVESLN